MDGIIIINKPQGCTSHDIVYKVKKLLHEKVGHTGTLDPMAEGVLPLLVGKGTLCSKYLINHDKKYRVKLELGKKTDTADSEGKVIEQKDVDVKILKKLNVENILKTFLGQQEQIPPIYSAIKVNGKKLYEYARKGQKVEIKPRKIYIYNIELLSIESKIIEFDVECSKGTYIRSLCEDIANRLGTIGYMTALKRLRVGTFTIEDSISVNELEEKIENKIITIEKLFEDKDKIILEESMLNQFFNGVKINKNFENGIYKVYNEDNEFIGIATIENKILKRDIIVS